jgi:hypothetical protein
MLKQSRLMPAGILALLVLGGACTNPALSEVDRQITYTVRVFPEPEHGTLRLSEDHVTGSASITIYANPEPGYVLKEIILQPAAGNPSTVNTPGPKYSTPINTHNAVTATFEPKGAGTYTVSVDPAVGNGLIFPERLSGTSGAALRINVIPAEGYDLAEGSLKVISAGNGRLIEAPASLPYTFNLPAEDVKIEARFEELSPETFKSRAWKYLSAGQYDTAAALYESAYQRNRDDPELIFYSTLAELGNILIDPEVRSLLNTLSFNTIPSTLEDWVCDDLYWTETESQRWYTEYAATIYTPEDAVLPKIYNRISGFITPFGDFEFSQQPGRDHLVPGDTRPTREKFKNLIFWIMISSYRSGFNPFLERVNRYVFGEKFETAAVRAATLPEDARVLLNPRLKEQFKLDELYGSSGDTYIGKAEMDYIIGTLLAVKGAFEYLSVYDWTIDLQPWLMTEIKVNDGLDAILEKMFKLQESDQTHKSYWKDPATVAMILPLKNNFLQVRNTRALSRAKADISRAVVMTNASMDYWFGSVPGNTSQFTTAAKTGRQWAREGLAHAKTTIDGGVFYFPGRLPTKTEAEGGASWPAAGEETTNYGGVKVYGLDTGRFFTPGVFTLSNWLITELGGRAPSLYKLEWYEDRSQGYAQIFTGNYSPVTELIEGSGYESDVGGTGNDAPYGIYSFGINTKKFKEIFPQGFNGFGDTALFCEVFPSIPLWPWESTYFSGLNRPARKIYEFYHKITVD